MTNKTVPREPTPDMVYAGRMVIYGDPARSVTEAWQAMYDAAPEGESVTDEQAARLLESYAEGVKWGAAAMREQAAEACESLSITSPLGDYAIVPANSDYAKAVRLLPLPTEGGG